MPPVFPPILVAHRGYAARYPENTIEALRGAIDAGATWIEFDVQCSAEGVPLVHHDADLTRTAGDDRRVQDLPLDELRLVDVDEATRLGDAFAGTRVPTLAEVVALIAASPGVRAFVEIKSDPLMRFGVESMMTRVLEILAPVRSRCVIVSFVAEALHAARRLAAADGGIEIGWILRAVDEPTLAAARGLAPEYLFANVDLLPGDGPLPAGDWRWAVYEVDRVATALAFAARGAAFVETMAIGALLADPAFDAIRAEAADR